MSLLRVIFQLVGGAFDIESRFIIEDPENVVRMVKLLDNASERLQVLVFFTIMVCLLKLEFT